MTATTKHPLFRCLAAASVLAAAATASAQERVLGVDVSYWNRGSSSATANGITQAAWNTAFNTPNANGFTRSFAFVRASRGGTTGLSTGSGTPNNPPATETLSGRYDDPEFLRTMTRATTAGLLAGAYHYGRPDIVGNTGSDEADHFIEYASAYMRPGYLMPVLDLEDDSPSGVGATAQFAIDFSNRLYERMMIRPGIYVGGSRSANLENVSQSRQDQLAKPAAATPSVVGPAFPMLWNPRWPNEADPESIDVQRSNPKASYAGFYGPWDDYGTAQPWQFWQYSSVVSVPGLNSIDPNVDGDVCQGDIEYLNNSLVPAVWWNDASGDWGTMSNWNSGQPLSTFNANDMNNPPAPYAPHAGTGQTTPFTSYTLPAPRLPGVAGSGPTVTSGVNDTVILERPNANITVTVSSDAYNVRKLYMRETLNITGGSLRVNYDPTYRPDDSTTVLHGGPISAQFSGSVTLGGSGSLNVHTLQVDATQTFTLAGSTGQLRFNTIKLMPHGSSPARIRLTGNVNINPLSNATATIATGTGSGSSGFIDLGGGLRVFSVGNGTSTVDLAVNVPITNGGLTKSGLGTMSLGAANTFSGTTSVVQGTLLVTHSNALAASPIVVQTGGTLALPSTSRLVLSTTSVTVDEATGGAIDIGKGRITIAPGGTSEAALRADLIAGRAGGSFSGTSGIMTTGGTAGLATTAVVGYRVLASGSAIVAWAAFGDANLDGQVNFSDISLVNNGGKFGQGSSTGATWAEGDFNYSGGVTFTDINLMNNSGLYGRGSYLPVAGAALDLGTAGVPTLASVPEPGGWALALAGLGWLATRCGGKSSRAARRARERRRCPRPTARNQALRP